MSEFVPAKYLCRKAGRSLYLGFVLLIPILAVISYFFIGNDLSASLENPGGSFLETAFWMTSIGTAFLSFIMMEVLFRSRAARILAPWPVEPRSLFYYQMKRVFAGIGISFIPYAAFWLPQLITEPLVAGFCVMIWPASLVICSAVSAAVILYTGNAAASEKENKASFGAMGFSMAPAVSLAVSLMITLLLKLLAEALLKPGFGNAALTAVGISLGVFLVSFFYAARLYRKRYYAILANFMDTDMIQLNAEYEFIDGKKAEQFRCVRSQNALISDAYQTMYRRRHPVSALLIVTFAVIMALVLWNKPDYLSSVFVPFLAAMPWVLFSRPWAAFMSPEMNTGLLDVLPVERELVDKGRLRASFSIMMSHGGILAAAVAIPYWGHMGGATALIYAALTFGICAVTTFLCSLLYPRVKNRFGRF